MVRAHPGAQYFCCLYVFVELSKNVDPGRTRTCNPLIRSQMPYPLGHRAGLGEHRKCQLVVKLTLHVERRASRPAGLGGAWGELSADVLSSVGAKNVKGAC